MSKLKPLVDLCKSLQHLQTQAEALGLFVDDRDLLECPACGLFEDVTELDVIEAEARETDKALRKTLKQLGI